MMKVLFLIPTLGHGGAERVLVNLVNNLDKARFQVTVQTLFDEGINKEFLNPDVCYKTFMKHQFRGNSILMSHIPSKLLYKLIVKDDYDIVVSFLEGPTAHIIGGCPKDTKTVAWFHTAATDNKTFSAGFKSAKDALKLYKSVDKFVCVSSDILSALEKLTGEKFSNYCVLYNVTETEKIKELANESVDDVNFPSDCVNIVGVGKIQEVKGFDRLAKAHKRLLDEGIKHRIYLIGAVGAEQKKIEEYLNSNKLTDSFTFLGFKENPYEYMSKADIFVCSSRREGFSGAICEALVLGLPVVSTKCSGVNEQLGTNNEYGIVVDNSEEGIYQGLKRMISDKALRDNYSKKSAERGKFFSKEQTVKAVEDMLSIL